MVKPIDAWAARYEIPPVQARRLQSLMRRRHRQDTRACNGDPHVFATPGDKSACSREWSKEVDQTISQIDRLLAPFGIVFDPGTGLWGSVMKDGRYIDDVPSEDRPVPSQLQDSIDKVIRDRAESIRYWVDVEGWTIQDAAAHVKKSTTLGPKSWDRVLELASANRD